MGASIIAGIVGQLVAPVTDLLGKFIEDKDKRNQLAFEIATMAATQAHDQTIAQLEVNQEEAKSTHLFVAGWRPFIGWTCGFAMGFNYILVPVLSGFDVDMSVLDITTMFPVLLGMLGLAGLRTTEKVQGVAAETLPQTTKGTAVLPRK